MLPLRFLDSYHKTQAEAEKCGSLAVLVTGIRIFRYRNLFGVRKKFMIKYVRPLNIKK